MREQMMRLTLATWAAMGLLSGCVSSDDELAGADNGADVTPNAFSFAPAGSATPGAVQTSSPAVITGIDGAAPISVSGGSYSIGCGTTYVTAPSTIANGQSVCLRHTAAAVQNSAVVTTLVVGGVAATFTSVTAAPSADTTPNSFGFAPNSNVTPGSVQTSNAVSISGMDAPAPISVSGGTYSIGCTTAFTSTAASISNGQSVCVRHVASSAASTITSTTLVIGDVAGTFTTLTAGSGGSGSGSGGDATPDAFSFNPASNVAPGSVQTSNTVVITGIDTAVPVSVSGGSYSIGCGGSFTTAAGSMSSGDSVCVRQTASSSAGAISNTTLVVGNGAATFTTLTAGGGSGGGARALWSTAYYPAYQLARMPIAEIPFAAMTHVVHFSLVPAHTSRGGGDPDPSTAGTPGALVDLFDLDLQTAPLVAAGHAAGVSVLLGVGGSAQVAAQLGFQDAVASNAARAALVNNIVDTVVDGGYDGADINWESIRFPDDVAGLRTLIIELRAAFDAVTPARHYLITYPAATAVNYFEYTPTAEMLQPLQTDIDQINLQTYIMAGPFPGWVTWHNSPLFSGDCLFPGSSTPPPSVASTIKAFLDAGIPPSKMGVGIQLAGWDWQGGSGTSTGGVSTICQPWDYSGSTGAGQDTGAPTYDHWVYHDASDILTDFIGAAGFVEHFDTLAKAPYLSRDAVGSANDHFVSYENEESIAAKADYIRAQGLGGAMIFESTGDYLPAQPAGDARHPLMSAVRDHIRE